MNTPLRFVQLSDLHLHPDTDYTYHGHQPLRSFLHIIEDIKQLEPPPKFLILTGDLASDKQEIVYFLIDQTLTSLGIPYYWIGGNHDHPDQMEAIVHKISVQAEKAFVQEGIHFILMDSVEKNREEDHGEFSDWDLEFLRKSLKDHPDLPTVLALHHHPFPVGAQWIDDLMLRDAQNFLDILETHEQVKMVIFGHIHHVFEKEYKGIHFLSAPSTAYQFRIAEEFGFEELAPGYRVFDFQADGSFVSAVKRID